VQHVDYDSERVQLIYYQRVDEVYKRILRLILLEYICNTVIYQRLRTTVQPLGNYPNWNTGSVEQSTSLTTDGYGYANSTTMEMVQVRLACKPALAIFIVLDSNR